MTTNRNIRNRAINEQELVSTITQPSQPGVSLLQYQNELNGGKCGVCGDPWGKPDPQFEAGGKYANGIITRTYTEGQVKH